jgi:RecA-family ATPase
MNKYYFIAPAVMLGVFLFFYRGALAEMDAKEEAHKREVATAKAADDVRRKEIEAKAEADARKRQEERDAEEKAKLEKKEREYQTAMNQLKDEADKYTADADKYAKESSDLEVQLANLRIQKEKTNREAFELTKSVELAKINRRTAEMEIQRLVEMVGTRAEKSALTALPPPPPAKP